MSAHVVVLGAGFGGLELSSRLTEALGEDVRVTLIDRADSFVVGFSKFDVLFGRHTADEVRMSYRDLSIDGVDFRRESVTAIDPAKRTVTTEAGSYAADHLVVALGADYAHEATPGFVDDGYEFYSVAGAERLRDVLQSFDAGTLVFGVLGAPYKCPPAPYEFMFLLHDHLVERGVRESVDIRFFNPMPAPLPPSPEISRTIIAGLDDRGITHEFGHRITEIDPAAKLARFGDGREEPYDLFVGVPVHRAPEVVQASGLTEGGTDGWVKVDPATLETPHPGVYAVGDCADPPVPRAGTFAEDAAAVVADHIIAAVRGRKPSTRFAGLGTCYVEFGGGLVGKVEADFLSGTKPVLEFAEPSQTYAREKEAFATTRRDRWFGGR